MTASDTAYLRTICHTPENVSHFIFIHSEIHLNRNTPTIFYPPESCGYAEVTLSSFLRNQPWVVCRECEEPSFFLEVWLQTPHYFAETFLIAINGVQINWCPLEFCKRPKLPIICNFVIAISHHKLHLYIFPLPVADDPTGETGWSTME